MKLRWLIPSAVLLALGGEGLYHALRGRTRVAIDCGELARAQPASHRLAVTGCEVVYAGAGVRGSGADAELFLPARPAGSTGAAPLVIVTRNPSVLAQARPVFDNSSSAGGPQSLAALEKIADAIGVRRSIEGLARAGLVERLRTRRILSQLSAAPVAEGAILLDLEGRPDFLRPLLALAVGLLFAALPFLPLRRGREREDRDEWPEAAAARLGVPEPPHGVAFVALPRLLLLNLATASGPETVETAPPLGSREQVIGILCGVIPDLAIDPGRRVLSRSDRSLRIDLGRDDPVATAVIDARGEAGAALVREILLMTSWRAFAPKTGLFVSGDELTVMAALTRDAR